MSMDWRSVETVPSGAEFWCLPDASGCGRTTASATLAWALWCLMWQSSISRCYCGTRRRRTNGITQRYGVNCFTSFTRNAPYFGQQITKTEQRLWSLPVQLWHTHSVKGFLKEPNWGQPSWIQDKLLLTCPMIPHPHLRMQQSNIKYFVINKTPFTCNQIINENLVVKDSNIEVLFNW